MEKNIKKDIEQLLIKETERILHKIDPASTVIFSKYIKNHCKELAKKFLKTQKKFQKQMEIISSASANTEPIGVANLKAKHDIKATPKNSKTIVIPKKSTPVTNTPIKKNTVKKTRKGNNLINAASVQKKVKTSIAKSILSSTKK